MSVITYNKVTPYSTLNMNLRNYASEFRLYLCNEWINRIPSHSVRQYFYRKVMGFSIGKHSSIFMDCTFDSARGITIGDYSVINSRCRLDTRGSITIGKNVSISQEVIILTADHDINSPDFTGRNRAVVIDDYVWIGTRAMILPGINIGKGAIVAAGAIVTKNVEPFTLVAGVPAKFVKRRQEDLNYQIIYQRLFQ